MRSLILTAALAVFIPSLTYAACGDDADALAQKYGITASLSSGAPSSSEATTETLAKSGGVITPPATGDLAAVTPSVPNPEPMKTAPELPPQTADGDPNFEGGGTGSAEDFRKEMDKTSKTAAIDSQAAALLQAAHAASAHGDEATCTQRLDDARTLLQKTPSASQ